MKALAILCLSLAAAASASATVTLQFSNTATGMATNWANSSGTGGLGLVWGIVIDTTGDGFDNSYFQGIDFGSPGTGQSLLLPDGSASDDMLVLSPVAMPRPSITADGFVPGSNVVTSIPNVPFGLNGIGFGDSFEIVWFDRTSFSGQSVYGEAFGAYVPAFGNPAFEIPADGSVTSYATNFAGPDPLKTMNYVLVPEPSSILLGLLGFGGLLRRRR